MKSYDFGQFLFNSSFLDESQLAELVIAAKNKKATLATKALFLRMVTLSELEESLKNLQATESLDEYLHSHEPEIQDKYDSMIKNVLKEGQPARLARIKESSSIWLVQELIDSGKVNAEQLEKLFEEYHKLEIPPIEEGFSKRYETLPPAQKLDYPLEVDVVKSFHEFTSESFGSTIILLPDSENAEGKLLGATVKVKGETPIIVGFFAEEDAFKKFAQAYNNLAEDLADAYDVVSEFLNIYVGHLTIRMVATLGREEEPETPRYGEAENFGAIKMLADWGEFYLYVSAEEFFKEELNKQAAGLDDAMDLSQFGLEDLDDDFDEKFKDPFDF